MGGIPSLDFRPVLALFAPTGNKLQVSPCEECGGTLEVRILVQQLSNETSSVYKKMRTTPARSKKSITKFWCVDKKAPALCPRKRLAVIPPPPSPQIVHYDEKEIVKLKGQIDTLREELVQSGNMLSNSEAVAETYRLQAEKSSAEFSEINNMLLRVSGSKETWYVR